MINPKYYDDITSLADQLAHRFEITLPAYGQIDRLIVCGMGGSTLYVPLLNDLRGAQLPFRIEANRSYTLPPFDPARSLLVVSSHSGNTEETLTCLQEALERDAQIVTITAGGRLQQLAEQHALPCYQLPGGLQPRLSTGYFVRACTHLLTHLGLLPAGSLDQLTDAATHLQPDESYARQLAAQLVDRLPILYSTTVTSSIASIGKIKCNENAKVQAFAHTFPELNHNEMAGWTRLVTDPSFMIFRSSLAHPRNLRRIEVFTDQLRQRDLPFELIDMPGETLAQQLFSTYQRLDYLTYYLAEQYGIDPEPVEIVENFKARLTE